MMGVGAGVGVVEQCEGDGNPFITWSSILLFMAGTVVVDCGIPQLAKFAESVTSSARGETRCN